MWQVGQDVYVTYYTGQTKLHFLKVRAIQPVPDGILHEETYEGTVPCLPHKTHLLIRSAADPIVSVQNSQEA